MNRIVLLKCTKTGCPRTVKIPWDKTMPKDTVEIQSPCPWHWEDRNSEFYYDKDGNELFLEGE